MRKELPIGVQDFEKIIKGNRLYVDKTDLVYKMAHKYNYVFLSRPRRFGKSLLMSTLEAYFKQRAAEQEGHPVVILVDEYDKPMLNAIGNPQLQEAFRSELNYNYRLDELTQERVTGDVLNSIDPSSQNPIPVIYQSGYLTISGYDDEFGLYSLDFPNREVEHGFTRFLMPYALRHRPSSDTPDGCQLLVRDQRD